MKQKKSTEIIKHAFDLRLATKVFYLPKTIRSGNCVTKRFHSHTPKSNQITEFHTGGGGGGAVKESLVAGVPPRPSNPDPV